MVCRAPGFRIVKLQSGFEDDRIIPDIGPFALALGWIDDANRASRRIWFRACVGQRTARAPRQSWWRGPAGAVQVRGAVNSPVKHRVYMTSNRSCVIATHE